MDYDVDAQQNLILMQQIAFIGRFCVVIGLLGILKWWAQKVIGLDIEKDINSIEEAARVFAESRGKEGSIWPLSLLLLAGLFVLADIVGKFISGGL